VLVQRDWENSILCNHLKQQRRPLIPLFSDNLFGLSKASASHLPSFIEPSIPLGKNLFFSGLELILRGDIAKRTAKRLYIVMPLTI